MRAIDLSVVIPTVESAYRIEATLHEVLYKLGLYRKMGIVNRFEVLPVAQTSNDDTFAVLHKWDSRKYFRPQYITTRGKGVACTFGIEKARYDWVMTFDDDLNYQMNFLLDAIPICDKYDIIIAARIGRQHMPLTRKIASRGYRWLAHRLYQLNGITDIQAGQKLIRKGIFTRDQYDAQTKIRMTEIGFVWDTELLHKAKSRGYKIAEVPIVYSYKESFLAVSSAWWRMGYDLLRLKFKIDDDPPVRPF